MDNKKVGAILFVFLSLLNLSHCEQTFYNYTDQCTKIIVKITADIVYPLKNNSTGTVKVDGNDFSKEDPLIDCDDGSASLNIAWKTGLYSLTLDFTENDETWELSSILFEYTTSDNSEFNNSKIDGDTLETNATKITDIDLGNSYRCISGVTYNLASPDSTVRLTLTDLQVQAFNFTKQNEFGKSKDCSVTPSVIPPVKVDANVSCIRVVMKITNITITYQNTSGNKTTVEAMRQAKDYNVIHDNCMNLTSQGHSRHAKITIGWPSNFHYNLSITFSANYKKGEQGWEIDGMTFGYINNSDLVAPQETSALLSFSKDFTDDDIALTRSYKCDKADQYDFKSDSSNSTATIALSFIQMQAFQFSNPQKQVFGSAVECDQAGTSVIVPILVGAALGLFVVILLLAYVVGRVRQRRAKSGYSRL